jgi:integrase
MGKLTDREVRTAKPGKHGDGDGLQLVVSPPTEANPKGARKWVLRFMQGRKAREMGLGSYPDVGLAEARDKAFAERKKARSGVDPIAERKKAPEKAAAIPTFGELADEIADQLAEGFRNEKHKAQWRMTLKVYAEPLRAKPVNAIDTEDVLGVLKPLWQTKPETASRLRGRVEKVLNAAKAKGLRSGENPAAWRGHLENLLPRQSKLTRGHHAALDYAKLPAFMADLREREAVAARCMEFAILTAARSGEALGARWQEIDETARVWTVPPDRMKAGREHRVPLTDRALDILAEMKRARVSDFIFPGQQRDRPLSVMAMEMVLRRMSVEVTVHGFRSTFRDWAGNETHFPRELAEHALAHVIGDKAEQAYRRGDALEKRRALMSAWDAFCAPPQITNVPQLHAASA